MKPVRLSVWIGLLLISLNASAEPPRVGAAYMHPTPPGAPAAAAYFNISNPSDEPLLITGASSEPGSKTELHLTEIVDDVATMRRQEEIRVEPGADLSFKPGGYHVMIMGLKAPPSVGDSVEVVLETSQGEVAVEIPVIESGADGHGMGMGMDGSGVGDSEEHEGQQELQ